MDLNKKIIDLYKETYSVSEVIRILKKDQITRIVKNKTVAIGREYINKILKKEGIYEGLKGKNYSLFHKSRIEKTLSEKYGVINPGQLSSHIGFRNNLPYYKPIHLHKLEIYRKEVHKKTKSIVNSKLFKIEKPKPSYCEYTGVLFSDSISSEVNPNCYRKSSIDHKYSVLWCFMNDISVEDCCKISNLSYVLKYTNTLKNNMTLIQFKPFIPLIRRIFEDEGIECQKVE